MQGNDTVSNLIAQIRNGYISGQLSISVKKSNFSLNILKLLMEEGFIKNYKIILNKKKLFVVESVQVFLRYNNNIPTIQNLKRISRPGRRLFVTQGSLWKTRQVFKIFFISTSAGILTDRRARILGIGGEVLFSLS
jgi:small subunit ribosomal protein S8